MCEECYSDENRITPLLNPLDCLENHTQYICGTCGRCICIEHDPNRGLQRWNFPFIAIFKNKANSRRNGTSLSSQKAKLSEKHIVSRSEEHPASSP